MRAMSGTTPVFEAEGVSVRLGGRTVVREASFALRPGERVALIGPSGAGKTTLLRAAIGLAEREVGTLRFRGEVIAEEGWPRVRRAVVFVAQRPAMPAGTLREILAAPFRYKSAESAFDPERAVALLTRVGLDPGRLDEVASRLSEGQQKRLALVRALLLGPAALLLDEPTSGLDPVGVERVEALLVELGAATGLACAVVTHDRGQAERLCHRAIDLAPYLYGSAA